MAACTFNGSQIYPWGRLEISHIRRTEPLVLVKGTSNNDACLKYSSWKKYVPFQKPLFHNSYSESFWEKGDAKKLPKKSVWSTFNTIFTMWLVDSSLHRGEFFGIRDFFDHLNLLGNTKTYVHERQHMIPYDTLPLPHLSHQSKILTPPYTHTHRAGILPPQQTSGKETTHTNAFLPRPRHQVRKMTHFQWILRKKCNNFLKHKNSPQIGSLIGKPSK